MAAYNELLQRCERQSEEIARQSEQMKLQLERNERQAEQIDRQFEEIDALIETNKRLQDRLDRIEALFFDGNMEIINECHVWLEEMMFERFTRALKHDFECKAAKAKIVKPILKKSFLKIEQTYVFVQYMSEIFELLSKNEIIFIHCTGNYPLDSTTSDKVKEFIRHEFPSWVNCDTYEDMVRRIEICNEIRLDRNEKIHKKPKDEVERNPDILTNAITVYDACAHTGSKKRKYLDIAKSFCELHH